MPEKWNSYHFVKMLFIGIGQMILGSIVETILYFKRRNQNKKN